MKVSDVFLPIVEGPEDQLMSRFSRILKFDPRKTKYYQATKKIITPRFLNELIIPQDIFSVLSISCFSVF